MGFRDLISRFFRRAPLEACPACGGEARVHRWRTLGHERFARDLSGMEALFSHGEFACAAALDDRGVIGDQLVHELLRCGGTVALVTTEDPVGLGLEPRIRRTMLLEGGAAELAWSCAR
jgi:hypothetical protein